MGYLRQSHDNELGRMFAPVMRKITETTSHNAGGICTPTPEERVGREQHRVGQNQTIVIQGIKVSAVDSGPRFHYRCRSRSGKGLSRLGQGYQYSSGTPICSRIAEDLVGELSSPHY